MPSGGWLVGFDEKKNQRTIITLNNILYELNKKVIRAVCVKRLELLQRYGVFFSLYSVGCFIFIQVFRFCVYRKFIMNNLFIFHAYEWICDLFHHKLGISIHIFKWFDEKLMVWWSSGLIFSRINFWYWRIHFVCSGFVLVFFQELGTHLVELWMS